VRTARALVAAEPRAEIHVFTDGAFTLPSDEDVADPRVCGWVGIGGMGNNVAITSLSIRKNYYGAFDYQAFVSLVNTPAEPKTFSCPTRARRQIDRREGGGPRAGVRGRWCCRSATRRGHRTARIGVDDDLAVDNVAYAVLRRRRRSLS